MVVFVNELDEWVWFGLRGNFRRISFKWACGCHGFTFFGLLMVRQMMSPVRSMVGAKQVKFFVIR